MLKKPTITIKLFYLKCCKEISVRNFWKTARVLKDSKLKRKVSDDYWKIKNGKENLTEAIL